ncbi:peptidylprolyl isomerase [Prosthecobacter fluviatilis]|uniref:Peptidylprolyl isomerase n=1 Tax=Prosthecobacter fluviatilis TaxID=445931 RepID=A0ABW0KV02_9BACT
MRPNRWSCVLLFCGWSSLVMAADGDPVVGSIGEIELRQSEVLASLGTMSAVDKEALARDPGSLNQLVRSLLVQRVVLQEALEKKWDEEPSIQPLLKSTREAAISDSYLKAVSRPPESYPSEGELKLAYENGRAALTVPRSFRLAQIFVAEEAGAEKKLKAVLQRLKEKPENFGQVAREMSEEKESASRDGEIGWLREQQIQPEILAQLPKLSVNMVSGPVRLKDGWHILKVLDVREAFTPIFEQVRVQLAQRMRAEKSRANVQSHVSELLQDRPVAVNEVALSKLLLEVPTQAVPAKP